MSELIELAEKVSHWILQASLEHGIVLTLLAFLGLISIISAIGQKAFMAFKYLFLICVAIPAILIVGLLNKDERKKRLKDLGEIKAHLKQNPKKWKKILYFVLLCIFILVVVLVIWFFVKRFLLPLDSLNEFSKQALQNYSINKSGGQ